MVQNEQEMQQIIYQIQSCEEEIGKAIIGQKAIIRQMLIAILTDGNVLLEGVPGLGKTQMVKAVSKAMNLAFSRIQFTPDLMPADVTGTNLIIREENQNKFQFEPGPVSPISFWRMRSTVQHRRHSPPCWRPCRKRPSRSVSRRIYYRSRLWYWQRRTRLRMRAHIHCRKHSWTVSCLS